MNRLPEVKPVPTPAWKLGPVQPQEPQISARQLIKADLLSSIQQRGTVRYNALLRITPRAYRDELPRLLRELHQAGLIWYFEYKRGSYVTLPETPKDLTFDEDLVSTPAAKVVRERMLASLSRKTAETETRLLHSRYGIDTIRAVARQLVKEGKLAMLQTPRHRLYRVL